MSQKKHHRGHSSKPSTEPSYNRPRSKLNDFLITGTVVVVVLLLVTWLILKLVS